MTGVTHDAVTFEIPDEWLRQFDLAAPVRLTEHFISGPSATILDIDSIRSPVRNPGVRWFDEGRMLDILKGIATSHPLPPIELVETRGERLPYRVHDGLHRYYASIAVGFRQVPVRVVPDFDINSM